MEVGREMRPFSLPAYKIICRSCKEKTFVRPTVELY
jgi:hypothetical protein